jgi:hypothetical protein
MPCKERGKLIQLLIEAVTAYGDAVHAAHGIEGEALERLTSVAESARNTYKDCREVLAAHERSHGCGIKSAETSTGIEEKRRSGFKPDTGPQQSFHLSRSFDAASNARAVRKLMGWIWLRRGLVRYHFSHQPPIA